MRRRGRPRKDPKSGAQCSSKGTAGIGPPGGKSRWGHQVAQGAQIAKGAWGTWLARTGADVKCGLEIALKAVDRARRGLPAQYQPRLTSAPSISS